MNRSGLLAVLVGCVLMLCASSAWAIDLTTFGDSAEQARVARYTVSMGIDFGETCGVMDWGSHTGLYRGAYDYISSRGWAWPWWYMNDGTLDNYCDTYGAGDAEDFYGYRFKRAASVSQINYANRVYFDGGTFAAAPRVEVLTAPMEKGGTWVTVPASWNVPYDSSYSDPASIRQYAVTINQPTGQVWGVRLIGAPHGTTDGNGFIGLGELQVFGDTSITKRIDLSNNLALGQTPLFSGSTQQGHPERLTDGIYRFFIADYYGAGNHYYNYVDTWGADGRDGKTYNEEYVGVMFDSRKANVTAIGTTQKMFYDGGWFLPGTTVVEYTTDGGATWTPVSGLDMGRWPDMEADLAALPWDYCHSELMKFDIIPVAIDGIRMRGTPYGQGFADATGFVGTVEFEVFASAVPEPSTAVLFLALVLGGWLWRFTRR